MNKLQGSWYNLQTLGTRRFKCGHCGSDVSSEKGYYACLPSGQKTGCAYWCHDCNRLTLIDNGIGQVPKSALGRQISKLPVDINNLYEEMRKSSSEGAYTLVVLGGRKLLMHIAVSLGAKENLKFVQYIEFLEENHFTPPKSSSWVKKIKDMGNESNHEIILANEENASQIIKFLDLLMTFNYEFADDDSHKPE